MKHLPQPATAIAWVALTFSLVGPAVAADRYLITSKSQIKPSVLRQLHGPQGPAGPRGLAGPQGTVGPQGSAGLPGAAGPAGNTETVVTGTVGPWIPLKLAPGVRTLPSGYPPAARLEGDVVRLRGSLEGAPSSRVWATVPVGLRPTDQDGAALYDVAVASTGVILSLDPTGKDPIVLGLDGDTYTR